MDNLTDTIVIIGQMNHWPSKDLSIINIDVILFNKLIITHRQQRGLALINPSTTVHFC